MDNAIPLNGQSFGRRRTITKFPRILGKVLVKGLSKVSRHLSQDTEALEKGALFMDSLSTALRSRSPESVQPVLAEIVELLLHDDNPRLQEQTAKSLAVVAAQVSPETCLELLEYPGLLEGLVRLLSKADRYYVQEGAALALTNLAGAGEECQRMVAEHPNAMAGIVVLLSQDRSAIVLQFGASLLFLLGLLPENQKMIVDFPGALEGLVRVLLKEQMPVAQGRAALALSVLAASPDTKGIIADFPQALMGILQLLNLEDMPEVQEFAVGAVANLITAETTPTILEFPNILSKLVLLAPTCEAALVAIINLDLYNKKQSSQEMLAEHALARSRRLPELRLLNYRTSV